MLGIAIEASSSPAPQNDRRSDYGAPALTFVSRGIRLPGQGDGVARRGMLDDGAARGTRGFLALRPYLAAPSHSAALK
jgi:hypothetical protein